MIRTLKGLGLALVAVLALSAIAAGSASAAFESENEGTTTLTRSANNTQTFKYSTFSLSVNCTTVGGSGSASGKSSEVSEFSPTYSGCTTSLGQTADVSMNECKYVFTSAVGSTSATVHLVCPAGKKVEVTITEPVGTSICTLKLGSQTPSGTTTLSNTGTGTTREVDTVSNQTGIVGEREGSSACGPLNSTSGTYSGSVTTTGESGGSHVGIWTD